MKDTLQHYIYNTSDWEQKIEEEFRIRMKYEDEHFIFNYSLMDEPRFDRSETRLARGSIFDGKYYSRVCAPFVKFFNVGEELAPTLDFSKDISILDKVDGSFIKIWWSERLNRWFISSNGSVNVRNVKVTMPSINVETFYEAIKDIEPGLENYWEKDYPLLDKSYTYMLELCHETNPIIVKPDNTLTLLGIMKNDLSEDLLISERTSHDLQNKFLSQFPSIKLPKEYDIQWSSMEDIKDFVENLNEEGKRAEVEGVVVVEHNNGYVSNRVKLKNSKYLLFHNTVDVPYTINQFTKAIYENEIAEFDAYKDVMPVHTAELWENVKSAYKNLKDRLEFEVDVVISSIIEEFEVDADFTNEEIRKQLFIRFGEFTKTPLIKKIVIKIILQEYDFEKALLDINKRTFINLLKEELRKIE